MTTSISALVLENFWGILQCVTTILVAWAWWSLRRIFVTRAGFEAYKTSVNNRLEIIEERQFTRTMALQKIDLKLDSLPTGEEMQSMALSIKEVEGDVKGIKAQMDGLSHATARLEKAVDMFSESHMRDG